MTEQHALALAFTRYFASVTAGLEAVAWQEISWLPGAQLLALGHRCIEFTYAGRPQALLLLRCVDDAFLWLATLIGMGHTRAALVALREQAADLELEGALERCRELRPLPAQPRFAITASFVGARNYGRYELAEALAAGLRARNDWIYVENTPTAHDPHDIHLRLMLEEERALLGLRLAEQPLHRRPYKLASRPGSLKAPVAYAMALLAGVTTGQIVLDPLCGVGTLALEAAQLAHPAPVLAGDISRTAVADARLNATDSPYAPLLLVADATALPLPAAAVDAIISNLPFGGQVQLAGDLSASYGGILGECARVLRPGGRAALLTDQGQALMAAARAQPALRLIAAHQISLFGRHPIIYVFLCDTGRTFA